jgi:hypothetical protein
MFLTFGEVNTDLVWNDYQTFFYRWMSAVVVLSAIRSAFLYGIAVYRRKDCSIDSTLKSSAGLKLHLIVTTQYLAVFLLAGLFSFWFFIASVNGMVNIGLAWQGYEPLLRSWVLGIIVLSGIRLLLIRIIETNQSEG